MTKESGELSLRILEKALYLVYGAFFIFNSRIAINMRNRQGVKPWLRNQISDIWFHFRLDFPLTYCQIALIYIIGEKLRIYMAVWY